MRVCGSWFDSGYGPGRVRGECGCQRALDAEPQIDLALLLQIAFVDLYFVMVRIRAALEFAQARVELWLELLEHAEQLRARRGGYERPEGPEMPDGGITQHLPLACTSLRALRWLGSAHSPACRQAHSTITVKASSVLIG